MSASDDIEKSIEASLEEFVNQANAAFAEDFDGWDIAREGVEVRSFAELKRQQEEAARQASEAARLQQEASLKVTAPLPDDEESSETTEVARPLTKPSLPQERSARPARLDDSISDALTVRMEKAPVEELDQTVPQPKVPAQGMSKGFLFATMLGAFLIGALVVLAAVKFFMPAPAPQIVIPHKPELAPLPATPGTVPAPQGGVAGTAREQRGTEEASRSAAAESPTAPQPAPSLPAAPDTKIAPKAAPDETTGAEGVPAEASGTAAVEREAAVKPARPAAKPAPRPAAPRPAAAAKPKPAPKAEAAPKPAPAKPKPKSSGELIDVF